jgi:hypothetical protein
MEFDCGAEDAIVKAVQSGSDIELTNKIELYDCRGQKIDVSRISGLGDGCGLKIHNADVNWESVVED